MAKFHGAYDGHAGLCPARHSASVTRNVSLHLPNAPVFQSVWWVGPFNPEMFKASKPLLELLVLSTGEVQQQIA